MSQTAVLVWLSASSLLPTFRAELGDFAQSHLLRLEAPRQNATTLARPGYAPDLVAELELELEEARNAAAALEPGRALSALERADTELRAHPELPQSAWLMAEALWLRAEVEGQTAGGTDAASALRERARALEGVRAAPFSERELVVEPSRALTTRSVRVEGLEIGDALEWDGLLGATEVHCVPGEHHARVLRQGRLLWAGWVRVGSDESSLRLPVPSTVACSPDDIGQSRFDDHRALPAPHARCESYVLARVDRAGTLEMALCEHERCGVSTRWNRSPAPSIDHARARPVWPYAVTAAAGVLAITTLILWRGGAFDRGETRPTESWVYNGQKPMGFRF